MKWISFDLWSSRKTFRLKTIAVNPTQVQNLHWSLPTQSVQIWLKLYNPLSCWKFIQASGVIQPLRQILVKASGFVALEKDTKHRQLWRSKLKKHLFFFTFDVIVYNTCIDTVISWRAASASSCFVLSKMLCSPAFLFSSSTRALASFSFETPA